MSLTTFLSNEALWQELYRRVKAAWHVDAAIAYFGQGGAKLLPLRRGDRLIVDMSPAIVQAGGTDPREIEKLIRRGVHVYTRRHLHAKTIVADRYVISGSANVSKRSQQLLDEAAIFTNDQSAVRRAREFIERLSTELNAGASIGLRRSSCVLAWRGFGNTDREIAARRDYSH